MIWYAARKGLGLVLTLLAAAAVIFVTLDLLPGDPARFILGINATPDSLAALQIQLRLEQPFWQRFLGWIGGIVIGDFGMSPTLGQPVGALIAGRLGVSLPLIVFALLVSLLIGLPIGFLAARRPGSLADKGLMVLARLGVATPNFWLGMLLVLLFSVTLRWLPPGGFVPWTNDPSAALASLMLPVLALALPQAAVLAQATRQALVDAQASDYVRAARARGLTLGEAVWRHGMRNALLPVIGIGGMQLAVLIAGAVIVENVFYLPGLGRLILDAAGARDLVLVRGATLVLVSVIAVTFFAAALLGAWTDPRLRERRQG